MVILLISAKLGTCYVELKKHFFLFIPEIKILKVIQKLRILFTVVIIDYSHMCPLQYGYLYI